MNFTMKHFCFKNSFLAKGVVYVLALSPLFLAFPTPAAGLSYSEDTTDFDNPERGFWGRTLVKNYVDIYNYRNSAFPQAFLDKMQAAFDSCRNTGKKMVLRFKYGNGGLGDPSVQQMFSHLEQLRPLLNQNYDVLAVFEAGFVGAYGEWNRSSFVNTPETRREVLFKILDVVPKERMVAMRYNYHKREIFNTNEPVTASEAFNGSNRSRTSAHNDCFLSFEDNAGTFRANDGKWGLGVEAEKNFLASDNLYLSQGGESCEIGDLTYATCDKALADLKKMHWDMLNNVYYPAKLQQWKTQGCYEQISKQLGYRLRLLDATLDDAVNDGNLHGSIHIKNEGFGKIFNPRKIELVLRHKGNGTEYILPLPFDPRFWSPGLGQTLNINLPIPKSVPFGAYSLYLNLPDPMPTLYGKPQYSIRLANKGVWDPIKGFNSLEHTVQINSFNPSAISRNIIGSSQSQSKVSIGIGNALNGIIPIDIVMPESNDLNINVHDLTGKQIIQLAHGNRNAGSYSFLWKGQDQLGHSVSAGTYFLSTRVGGQSRTIRIFLQK